MDLTQLILGVGAIISGVAGIGTAWAAVKKAKRETQEEADKMLQDYREQNEHQARQLHWWRLQHLDEKEPEDL